jgi:hypothetical protein
MMLVLLVSIGYVAVSFYNDYKINNEYTINHDKASIQTGISEKLNREVDLDLKVLKIVQLDDTSSYISLFQLKNGHFGFAQLTEGPNGKLKVKTFGHGSNLVRYQKVLTEQGVYGVLYGINKNRKIDHIKAKLLGEEYSFITNVSLDERILNYEKLPATIKDPFPAKLTFFDKDKNIIIPSTP